MTSVWVVEKGNYSDGNDRVIGVFSTEDNAEKVANLAKGRVIEWPLDPWVDEINQGKRLYHVEIALDGTMQRVSEATWQYNIEDADNKYIIRHSRSSDRLVGNVFATDETHAIKIMNEHRAQFIAEGKWPE